MSPTSSPRSVLLIFCRRCPAQYKEAEPALPRSFIWLLQLFSFLLQVKVSRLYKEVLQVERRVFRAGPPPAHLLYR